MKFHLNKPFFLRTMLISLMAISFVFNSCKKDDDNDKKNNNGNIAPTCQIIASSESILYNTGAVIQLKVNAEDTDGSINKVSLFINNSLEEHLTEEPYQFQINTWNFTKDTNLLTVLAEDNEGKTSSDEIIAIKNHSTILLDGFYILGNGTTFTNLAEAGRMQVTRNEVTQEHRDQLLEIYVAVEADSSGFNIVEIAGSTQKIYGPAEDFAEITNPTHTEPHDAKFWRGGLDETSTAFTVPEDGLYHVIIDTELKKVVIARVSWGVIGTATPGGWSNDTPLATGNFDKNTMSFEATNVALTIAEFKFRYSGGWNIIIDSTFETGSYDIGVSVNTNLGEDISNLIPGGANMQIQTSGYYNIEMVWSINEGHVATLTKTGDLPATDYSDTELGLIGEGLIVDGTQHNWDETVDLHTPFVEGTNYTWTWNNIEVTPNGSFKIREGHDWNGLIIGYPQVNITGSAAGDFDTNSDGCFIASYNGTYNFSLQIESQTSTYNLAIEYVN